MIHKEDGNYLTTKEAAAALNVHVLTIRRMVKDSRISAIQFKPNGNFYFKQSEIERFLLEQQKMKKLSFKDVRSHIYLFNRKYLGIDSRVIKKEKKELSQSLQLTHGSSLMMDKRTADALTNILYQSTPEICFGTFISSLDYKDYQGYFVQKQDVYIGEVYRQFLNNYSKTKTPFNDKLLIVKHIQPAIANALHGKKQRPTKLLVVTSLENPEDKFVIDATMHQYFALNEKGISIMRYSIAEQFYEDIIVLSLEDYANSLSQEPYVSHVTDLIKQVHNTSFVSDEERIEQLMLEGFTQEDAVAKVASFYGITNKDIKEN